MDRSLPRGRLLGLATFGIAMGFLEAIVVVYLRELYFPGGFGFPLRSIPARMFPLEMLRELCTLVMLIAVALVTAEGFLPRCAVLLFLFGTWDLSYYAFLKILLDWPKSLFTWDVLFLIPVAWLGPVLAPVLCALTMIGLSILWLRLYRTGRTGLGTQAWVLLGGGALLIFMAFVRDSTEILIRGGFFADLAGLTRSSDPRTALAAFVPERFSWLVFSAGEVLLLLSGVAAYRYRRNG